MQRERGEKTMNVLNNIRTPDIKVEFKTAMRHAVLIAEGGVSAGVAARLSDIYTTNLGNVFS